LDSQSPAQAKQPQLSIIVAVLNAHNTLEHCIQSIVAQTYPNKELIIMDGGSSDGSVSIIRSHENNIAYWDSKPDRGIYHAWNKALARASGEWICFLGADDYFCNDQVLTDLHPSLRQAAASGIRVVYGRIARVDDRGRLLARWGKPWEKIRWQMPHGMPIGMPHTGLMHHRNLFSDHGLFDDSFRIAGDYELLLRELKHKNSRALFVEDVITVTQRVGGLADSNSLFFHTEVLRARRKNGINRISLVWMLIHIRTFFREKWRALISRSRADNIKT
jgi:glycosyltransferase involved in cell wall biosynthesis